MSRFRLMMRDKEIGLVNINGNGVQVVSFDSNMYRIYYDIQKLLSHKLSVSSRKTVKSFMSKSGAVTAEDVARWTHGVSISDNMWLREEGTTYKWNDVSPFGIRLDTAIARSAFYGLDNIDKDKLGIENGNTFGATSASVNIRLGGTSDKCVMTNSNGVISLFKARDAIEGNYGNLRIYMEGIATSIARQLGIKNSTKYSIYENKLDGDETRAISVCSLYTGDYINAVSIEDSKLEDRQIKQLANSFNTEGCATLCDMVMLDSILVNIGRSKAKMEILFDEDFKIISLAPAYDFDMTLGIWVKDLEGDIKEQARIASSKVSKNFGTTFNEMAVKLACKDTVDRINNVDVDKINFSKYSELTEERIEFIKEFVRCRVDSVTKSIKESRCL